MKYRTFFKIASLGAWFMISHASFGQSNSLRKKISQGYKTDRIEAIKKEYKRAPVDVKNADRIFARANSMLIDVDALGNRLYYKSYNQISAVTAAIDEINSGGTMGLDLNGEGMIIGAWDMGIPEFNHPDLLGKVVVKDNSTERNITKHATHVSGTMVAAGDRSSRTRGLAPHAKLWVSDWTDDLEEMIALGRQGLLVSNHSYGLDPEKLPVYYYGAYTKTSQGLDAMTYSMKYYQPVIAAGNDRREYKDLNPTKNGSDLLTAMAVSKNAVVVAAVHQVTGYQNPSDVRMADFSNWGPTDDFRIKPDIAAQGVAVLSTIDTGEGGYGILSGTSMAAPAVSSVFALWQQYYGDLNLHAKALTSASIRGLMAHTAREAGMAQGPDHQFGWGLIDAAAGVTFLKEAAMLQGAFFSETALGQGEEKIYKIQVTEPTDLLKITLSWTDKEGVVKLGKTDDITPDLVVDLNVEVQKGSILYYPWRLRKDKENPAAERGINDVDNIEKVEIPNPEIGEYTVRVSHSKKLFLGEQDYSILISGINKINENTTAFDQGAKAWPNPVSDYVSLSVEGADMNGGSIEIYDKSGKNVLQIDAVQTNRKDMCKIDISMLKSGVYLIIFKKDRIKEVFTVIKL